MRQWASVTGTISKQQNPLYQTGWSGSNAVDWSPVDAQFQLSYGTPAILAEGFHCFPQAFQANAGIKPPITHYHLRENSFHPIAKCCILSTLKSLLNNLQK
jgi:hypothetical protein